MDKFILIIPLHAKSDKHYSPHHFISSVFSNWFICIRPKNNSHLKHLLTHPTLQTVSNIHQYKPTKYTAQHTYLMDTHTLTVLDLQSKADLQQASDIAVFYIEHMTPQDCSTHALNILKVSQPNSSGQY